MGDAVGTNVGRLGTSVGRLWMVLVGGIVLLSRGTDGDNDDGEEDITPGVMGAVVFLMNMMGERVRSTKYVLSFFPLGFICFVVISPFLLLPPLFCGVLVGPSLFLLLPLLVDIVFVFFESLSFVDESIFFFMVCFFTIGEDVPELLRVDAFTVGVIIVVVGDGDGDTKLLVVVVVVVFGSDVGSFLIILVEFLLSTSATRTTRSSSSLSPSLSVSG